MAKTIKQAKADIYLRDTDSQSLFNNSGELSFMYFHEWNDCYDKNTGKTAQIDGETYDESTGTYKPNCPSGCIPVFNGRQSALWDNMVSCFPDRIKSMYVTMRNNGLSYKDMLMKYKEFWRYWCENLYNADAFGYANTGRFDMAFGDKLQMMDYFFQKRQRYLDSKYCCGSSVSNNLRMRLSEVGKGFAIKYYQAIYSSLQWAVGSFDTQRNIEPGTYSYMPWKMAGNPQDTTFDIDDADLITELSTYTKNGSDCTISGLEGVGNFKFDSNMGILKRLTKFVMNYTEDKPNTNELGAYFDLSGMTLLKQVIVRNVKNLTKSIVINSDVVEEIDFTNTPIVGVTTPPSDSLTKLVLPDTITALTLNGYTNLQPNGLQIAGYSNINEFEVEGCPNINTLDLLAKCYEANAPLTEVTITGIDWTLDSLDMLIYLAQKNANLRGKITLARAVLVTLSQKIELLNAFGNIDDPNNNLYISYTKNEVSSITLNGKRYIDKIGTYNLILSSIPANGNDISDFQWSISENNFATISQTGVISVNKIGNKKNDDKATVSLQVTTLSGSTLKASMEVYFYKRDCEVGDYLFSDGTYGNSLYDNVNCSPVGIIFYIESSNKKAIAVALQDMNNSYLNSWGLSVQELPDISLNNYKEALYDISTIDNVNDVSQIACNKDNLINALDGSFKSYPPTHILGDLGFQIITSEIYNELSFYLDDMGKKVGDYISRGQLNTLHIIKHRDSILNDTSVNLPIPKATDSLTELQSLTYLSKTIIESHNNESKYSAYYYPKASQSYAYIPKLKDGEQLSDNLGLHHWFLPSSGELARLVFYENYTYNNDADYAIFKDGIAKSIYTCMFSSALYYPSHASSSEYNQDNFWSMPVNTPNFFIRYRSKGSNYNSVTRPVVEVNI